MDLAEAQTFLDQRRDEARVLALSAIRAAQTEVTQQGYKLTRAALLLASGRPLPELAKILASHSIIHTADGEFFREALLHACARAYLSVTKIKDRELLATASKSLRRNPAALTRFINDLGKSLGSPWTQDQKFATLAAWLTLAATQ
jgi:CelD/BcsL family acetyltransferase involved in cellulose biosynthesis